MPTGRGWEGLDALVQVPQGGLGTTRTLLVCSPLLCHVAYPVFSFWVQRKSRPLRSWPLSTSWQQLPGRAGISALDDLLLTEFRSSPASSRSGFAKAGEMGERKKVEADRQGGLTGGANGLSKEQRV